jgi:ABC-2 type transport system permease protein
VALAAFSFGFARHAGGIRAIEALEPAKRAITVALPFSMVASVVLLSSFIVGLFYSLDALHAERRDRSVLFWKSMPVSDWTTVLAKAFVPIAVQPVVAFTIALATQLLMLAVSAVLLPPFAEVNLAQMTAVMAYGLAIHALWFAPIYGYLLVMSAWAPRMPLLWAVTPVVAAIGVEKIAFGSDFLAYVLRYRFMGAMIEGFAPNALKNPVTQLSQLEPAHFFASPNLWLGLAIAAAFLYAAVRLRRYREPN